MGTSQREAERLGIELRDLRRRWIERIDEHDPPQRHRLALRVLTRMAHQYCLAKGRVFDGRIEEMRVLLHDALDAYAEAGKKDDSSVIRQLLFEPSTHRDPTDVLRDFMTARDWSTHQWKGNWKEWRDLFAAFLIEFVGAAGVPSESSRSETRVPTRTKPRQSSRQRLIQQVNRELSNISLRDVDRIDLHTYTVSPVSLPRVERLAINYCNARTLNLRHRRQQIQRLLKDALEAYSNSGNLEEGDALSQILLFRSKVPPVSYGSAIPYKFDTARKQSGLNMDQFMKYWSEAKLRFAAFLVTFAEDATLTRDDSRQVEATERLSPLHAFAWDLRQLRHKAGNPSFHEMQWVSHSWMSPEIGHQVPHEVFAEAEGGDTLPAWRTVEVYVKTCGGEPAEWRKRWEELSAAAKQVAAD